MAVGEIREFQWHFFSYSVECIVSNLACNFGMGLLLPQSSSLHGRSDRYHAFFFSCEGIA